MINISAILFGLVFVMFGSLFIFFPNFMRRIGSGMGEMGAATNNLRAKTVGLENQVQFTGADPNYSPSTKGLMIFGLIFVLFGLLILVSGFYYLLIHLAPF